VLAIITVLSTVVFLAIFLPLVRDDAGAAAGRADRGRPRHAGRSAAAARVRGRNDHYCGGPTSAPAVAAHLGLAALYVAVLFAASYVVWSWRTRVWARYPTS
jgi:hypothetical protein